MRCRRLAALLVATLVATSCAALNAESSPTTTVATATDNSNDIRRALVDLIRAGVPGAVVLIDDGVNPEKMFTNGVSDVSNTTAVAENSMFGIGAVSNAFMAATFLRLEEEGVVSLSDTVETWLPGLFTTGAQITINDLLRHTSGLPEWTDLDIRPAQGEDDPGSRGLVIEECLAEQETDRRGVPLSRDETVNPKCNWTNEQIVSLLEGVPSDSEPGQWRFSNTNYRVAAMVLEQITGRPAAELISGFVTGRIELGSTILPSDWAPLELPSRLAFGYQDLDGDGELNKVNDHLPAGIGADLGMLSSARNLATFYQELLEGDLLQTESKRLLLASLPTGTGTDQGLGVTYPLGNDRNIVGNTGETLGYSTWVEHNLDTSTTVVVMMNMSGERLPRNELAKVLTEATGQPRSLQLLPSSGFGMIRFRDVAG